MEKPREDVNVLRLMLAISRCKDGMQLFKALDSLSLYDVHHIHMMAEMVLASKKQQGVH